MTRKLERLLNHSSLEKNGNLSLGKSRAKRRGEKRRRKRLNNIVK